MPRALLLKKPKFEDPDDGNSILDINQDAKIIKKSSKKTKPTKTLRKRAATLDQVTNVTKLKKESDDQDSESEDDQLQHFVKWLKKDGKTFKVWECGICQKEFTHQYTLTRHLPTHTDERNFKCDMCSKAFRQASTLCRHKAIHSDARPFLCSVCGKAFNRSSTLIAHRKTHCESKPYQCHVCGKGFHQKGNLKNHIYTHTGERPYRCNQCERGFNQLSNLMCHKVHAHIEKRKHICLICEQEFPHKYGLYNHQEYKHRIKLNAAGEKTTTDSAISCHKPRTSTKTITLPNGDKTIRFEDDIQALSETNCNGVNPTLVTTSKPSVSRSKDVNEVESIGTANNDEITGILIDPIVSPALTAMQQCDQIPFALFKPAKGISVLVKILETTDGKQVLVPATADELRAAAKITISPNLNHGDAVIKAVQIKVPVVAIVSQKESTSGELTIEVEIVNMVETQEIATEQATLDAVNVSLQTLLQACDSAALENGPLVNNGESSSETMSANFEGAAIMSLVQTLENTQ